MHRHTNIHQLASSIFFFFSFSNLRRNFVNFNTLSSRKKALRVGIASQIWATAINLSMYYSIESSDRFRSSLHTFFKIGSLNFRSTFTSNKKRTRTISPAGCSDGIRCNRKRKQHFKLDTCIKHIGCNAHGFVIQHPLLRPSSPHKVQRLRLTTRKEWK